MNNLVVKSAVSQVAKDEGFRLSPEVFATLSDNLRETLGRAAKRARANNRTTIYDTDL